MNIKKLSMNSWNVSTIQIEKHDMAPHLLRLMMILKITQLKTNKIYLQF